MPELERWVLHRVAELDLRLRRALETHDWTGVYPDIHAFCSADLSAFYFDIRKDALYCDAVDSPRRRAARTVLDQLHRCLTAWLAPVLCFTAEEAWLARFPSEDGSVHLAAVPGHPRHLVGPGAGRSLERAPESARGDDDGAGGGAGPPSRSGASLQADLVLPPEAVALLEPDGWAELAIVSGARPGPGLVVERGGRGQVRAVLARAAGGRREAALPTVPRGVGGGAPAPACGGMIRFGALAAAVVLLADQGSKWWVLEVLRLPEVGSVPLLPVLSLTMVWNQGVTFGLFHQEGVAGPWILASVALAVVVALAFWLRRAETRLVAVALGAIAGGAVGNVLDRLRFGAVVDFIHAHAGGWSWYVFNVADAAIVCGVAGLGARRDPARAFPLADARHPAVKARVMRTRYLLLLPVLALPACSGDELTRTFGLTRDAPDEFQVTTRAPLSMPPDFTLRPPRPGATRPQELTQRQQAEAVLVPDTVLSGPNRTQSAGQQALVARAGRPAPADIRARIDNEAALDTPEPELLGPAHVLAVRAAARHDGRPDARGRPAAAECGAGAEPGGRGHADHPAQAAGLLQQPVLAWWGR